MHAVEGMACSQWIYHPADRNKTQWPYQNHHILPSICRTIRNLPPPTDSQPTGQTSTQSKPFRLSSHPQFKTSPTASNDNENTIDVDDVSSSLPPATGDRVGALENDSNGSTIVDGLPVQRPSFNHPLLDTLFCTAFSGEACHL